MPFLNFNLWVLYQQSKYKVHNHCLFHGCLKTFNFTTPDQLFCCLLIVTNIQQQICHITPYY